VSQRRSASRGVSMRTFSVQESTRTYGTLKNSFNTKSQIRPKMIAMAACVAVLIAAGATFASLDGVVPKIQVFSDPAGLFATLNQQGPTVEANNPFFQDLGTNGRRCVTCHQPSDAWTVTPPHIQQRFDATNGTDPIFRPVDGSGCPNQDVSTLDARRQSYSLLLNKGLIRVGISVPPSPIGEFEFTVLNNHNPYGCTSTSEISQYRRPLPATNLPFLSTVMWDGRETFSVNGHLQPLSFDLADQAAGATLGHAQGAQAPTSAQLQQIVEFETHLFTAQVNDLQGGELDALGANGGPVPLSQQTFFLGINDPLGGNPTGAAFNPKIFNLFDSWANLPGSQNDQNTLARQSVARGQNLFNTLPITITGVAGLNDVLCKSDPFNPAIVCGTLCQTQPNASNACGQPIQGFCGTCHNTPNVGDHSLPAPLDIGLADASRRTLDLPLITVVCNATGETLQVSDLGRAMITGKCRDIGKVKGPILRGLSARAPYFHNGSAATLLDVVNFYDERFSLHLTDQQKADLVAFLKTL
jgi:cytochrome c peroxidase